ncbi:hypothetical protein [Paraburkholderia tropica]|uniref:hypothetical protein n=1 Tax=Paraburkholderia tropica TaxID=92647 RepID=UPI002AB0E38B|nr:hypothetical protein [Paraburkholderia tropica]
MKHHILFCAIGLALLAGCSSASGPAHNLDVMTSTQGAPVYRVQCQGLFSSSQTCMKQAEKICGEGAVNLVSTIDKAASGTEASGDPRELTFTCAAHKAAPVVQ